MAEAQAQPKRKRNNFHKGQVQPNTKGHRRTATFEEWKDGTGQVRIGRMTVKMLKGEVDLSEWSDEDLMKGFRHKRGHPPNMIPIQVYHELVNRVVSRARHRFAAELEVAVNKHIAIVNGIKTRKVRVDGHVIEVARDVTPVQLRALDMLYERVLGKAEEHVMLHDGDAPWREMVAQGIVGTVDQMKELMEKNDDVIEGEVVDEAV